MRFIKPIHGVMVSDTAGVLRGDDLYIDIKLEAEPGRDISINGIKAEERDGFYFASCPLKTYENALVAVDALSGDSSAITVFRLFDAGRHYRLSVDDAIWFLQDIAKNNYKSIFENPFLALYRDIHLKYGTKVHMNVYYCCPENGGFALCQMPDKYKSEWESNSDWLRLSFHAFQNLPDRPYDLASFDGARGDCELVNREIIRFAGEKTLSDYTTVHWCSGTQEACRAWRSCGYKSIQAEPLNYDDGIYSDPIAYYMRDDDFLEGVAEYGYLKDIKEDIIFTTADIILNLPHLNRENIKKQLSDIERVYPMRNYKELLIHEQYFYKDYVAYLPDYRDRIEAGIEWCIERGYTPEFRGDTVRR